MNIVRCACVAAFLVSVANGGKADTNKPNRIIPWDLPVLFETPKIHDTTNCPAPGTRTFFFEGADYKGKPTWVFSYYAAPEGKPPEGGWPAVVCSHGGGGTAYPDWVRTWNKHGYAAIAFDQEGHLPDGRAHENAGPSRVSWFGDIALPDKEQWFYHAVADVIRANSLLRSFPGINTNKIGLTGISWGATISCTVAGLDPRFAFAVPVYGCGYIRRHEMNDDQYRDYLARWDPSAYLPFARMPMLWMTGFDDGSFSVDIWARSAMLSPGPTKLCIRGHMVHGHIFGWQKPELYVFADSVIKGGAPLPDIGRPEVDPKTGLVHAKIAGKFVGASVCFTVKDEAWRQPKHPFDQAMRWDNIACDVGAGEVVSRKRLPEGVKAFNVNGKSDLGYLVSSQFVEVKAQ